MAVLRESVDQIIYGPIVVGVGLAILGLQLVVLVIAVRRRRRGAAPPLSLKLHAIAGAWIAVFPVVVGISVHAARASMLRVYAGGDSVDASEKAMALSRGMSGQTNAIPLAISMTFLALVIWFIGLAYTLSAPRSDGRSPSLPPAALVGLGLLPVALGALQWCTGMIKSFAGMAGMPPEAKAAVVEGALEAARAQLTYYARISWFAIPTLAVMAVVLIVVRGRAGAETRAPAPARGATCPWPPRRWRCCWRRCLSWRYSRRRPKTRCPGHRRPDPSSCFREGHRRPIWSGRMRPGAHRWWSSFAIG